MWGCHLALPVQWQTPSQFYTQISSAVPEKPPITSGGLEGERYVRMFTKGQKIYSGCTQLHSTSDCLFCYVAIPMECLQNQRGVRLLLRSKRPAYSQEIVIVLQGDNVIWIHAMWILPKPKIIRKKASKKHHPKHKTKADFIWIKCN